MSLSGRTAAIALLAAVAAGCGKDSDGKGSSPDSSGAVSSGGQMNSSTANSSEGASTGGRLNSSVGQSSDTGGSGGATSLATGGGPASGGGPGSGGGPMAPAQFPLTVSSDKTHLVDDASVPFLLVGDTGWSLIAQLSKSEASTYLDDRVGRGFNTIVANLLEHQFSSSSPAWENAEGVAPFADVNDFASVNTEYFDHAAWVVEQAAERGILLLMTPMYIGYECGTEGWCTEMFANGVEKLTAYGQYLGERFRDYPNIVWVHGGDHSATTSGSPSQMDLVNAIREGLAQTDREDRLQTAHWTRGTSSAELAGVDWVDLDATYSGQRLLTYQDSLADYERNEGVRPTFFFEGYYEGERDMTGAELRAQMCQPVLSGSAGFVLGNNPIWYFGQPADGNPGWEFSTGPQVAWSEALDSEAARDTQSVASFFNSIPWHTLRPDVTHEVLTNGTDNGNSNAVLAIAEDSSLAVAYFTAQFAASLDLARFDGSVAAQWVDPTSRNVIQVEGSPFEGGSQQSLTPPGTNAANAQDWFLVLRAD